MRTDNYISFNYNYIPCITTGRAQLKKSFLKTAMVMSFMGWIYAIAYRFAFPVGITEGHPLP